jgi:hypothetical protein
VGSTCESFMGILEKVLAAFNAKRGPNDEKRRINRLPLACSQPQKKEM